MQQARQLASLALLALGACAPFHDPHLDPGDSGSSGHLIVTPDDLHFSTVAGEPEQQRFMIVNELGHSTTLYGHTDADGDELAFSIPGLPPILELGAGESIEVPVRFSPPADGLFAATIRVNNAFPVRLRGDGLAAAARLQVGPKPQVPVGCKGRAELSVHNEGRVPLRLTLAEHDNPEEFELLAVEEHWIDPGEQQMIALAFRPHREGLRTASLRFHTNDPARPELWAMVEGRGEGRLEVEERHVYDGSVPSWTLAEPAEEPTVEVRIDDRRAADWHYLPESWTVQLEREPEPGSEIRLIYTPQGMCP